MNDLTNSSIEGYRLSPQQLRVCLLGGDCVDTAYRVGAVVRIEGCLDADRLRAQLRVLGQRYEILRSTFRRLPTMTMPLQVIDAGVSLRWEVEDLAGAELTSRKTSSFSDFCELLAGGRSR